MRIHLALVVLCGNLVAGVSSAAFALDEPMQPLSGFGSNRLDLCQEECAVRHDIDDVTNPERVSYFVPKTLKHGATAPVVVYMHGFFAPVPEIYQDHIDHLTRQGYIVIFPQYHAAGWELMSEMGVFSPADQVEWLHHAVNATNHALAEIGASADRSQMYAYGHSIGGLLLLGWDQAGGAKLAGMVLANPKLDLKAGIPDFVKQFIQVKELPWQELAGGVCGRVMVLGGADDNIALVSELRTISHYLTNAKSVVMYVANSDEHSDVKVWADHVAAATNAGFMKYFDWMMDPEGRNRIGLNTFDYRFYYAALDGLLEGKLQVDFDMGHWSDGYPFAKIVKTYESRAGVARDL